MSRCIERTAVAEWILDQEVASFTDAVVFSARSLPEAHDSTAALVRYADVVIARPNATTSLDEAFNIHAVGNASPKPLWFGMAAHALAVVVPAGAALRRTRPSATSELEESVDAARLTPALSDELSSMRAARAGASTRSAILVVAVLLIGLLWAMHDWPSADAARVDNAVSIDENTRTITVRERSGTRHYVVGEAGDQVVLGDWDGDGIRTPAIYRPSVGDVWVFDASAFDDATPAQLTAHGVTGGTLRVQRFAGVDRVVIEPRSTATQGAS